MSPDDLTNDKDVHVFEWNPSYGGGLKFVPARSRDDAVARFKGYKGHCTYLGTIDDLKQIILEKASSTNTTITYGHQE